MSGQIDPSQNNGVAAREANGASTEDQSSTPSNAAAINGTAKAGDATSAATANGTVTAIDKTTTTNGHDHTGATKTLGAEATVSTWFHKACKEVAPLLSSAKDGYQGALEGRGATVHYTPGQVPAVYTNLENLWDGTPEILRYYFMEGTDKQKQKVREAIQEWTWYANVVFEELTAAADGSIRIRFDPSDGSWSYVAKQCRSVKSLTDATMNLAWVDQYSDITMNERAVILHEFGHTLGLLHEHQSPAHGGTAVQNIQATIDLYTKTQGWSIQQIYDQVINVYSMADVSNFSQVDVLSIMHYPQPKEITGLPEDIPYNQKLTDLDKAYMILQYPRKTMHPMAAQDGWSFEKALTVMGVPDDLSKEILQFLETDRDEITGEISPTNSRKKIADWTREAHLTGGVSDTTTSPSNPAHTVANIEKYGQVTAIVKQGQDLCAVESQHASAGNKPVHAVTDQTCLYKLPGPTDNSIVITYIMRAVDGTKKAEAVTADQAALVTATTAVWSAYADVTFNPAKVGESVDLIIQFNNMNPSKLDPDDYERSTCLMIEADEKASLDRTKARILTKEDPTMSTVEAEIEYNGIFKTGAAATAFTSTYISAESGAKVNGAALNYRSVLHELGHWLGLHHEYCGLYGHWMHHEFPVEDAVTHTNAEEKALAEQLAHSLFATRYDAGSIMDCMGVSITDTTVRVLQSKGLAAASVTALQDRTKDHAISTVNLALTLSTYDKANIAFLYPGRNLVDPAALGHYTLKVSQSNSKQTKVEEYLRQLQLYSETNLSTLVAPLKVGQWQAARKAYLDIIDNAQKAEAATEQKYREFIADKLEVKGTGISGVFDVTIKDNKDVSGDKPSHGVDGPAHGVTDPNDPANTGAGGSSTAKANGEGSFIYELYQKLSSLYCPGGAQYFALQFPTRFLDKQTFEYKVDGYFSRFEKPVVVNEAEFALTDQLYDVAPIVGGPNGQSLSKNYEKALNSLIPTFENIEVRKQREKMRAWLLKETKSGNTAYTVDTRLTIPGIDATSAKELSDETGMQITAGATIAGEAPADQTIAKAMAKQAIKVIQDGARADPRGMTRIEFADSLMQTYLNDRKTWELQKDDMIKQASDAAVTDPLSMEKLTRRLAHISAIEEAKLASKYADAVVRGYSHTVRGFMGHLDIKSSAESLQDAKDSFRESSLSSIYTASNVYPVSMQPTDWFEALDTGFTREDLAQDPDLIKAAVKAKSQLIDTLEDQIGNLRAFYKGNPDDAKAKLDELAKVRENAMAALSSKYTASTISAVKLAIQVAGAVTPAGAAATAASAGIKAVMARGNDDPDKKSLTSIFGGDSQALDNIGAEMDAVGKANADVNAASRALTEQMSEYSSAMAGDTQTMVESLQRQLTTAKADLAELQQSYTIATRADPSAVPGKLDDVGKLPAGNGGSRWSEVHISSEVNNSYTATQATSSSSVSSYSCNFWIGSYSSSTSTSSASDSSFSTASSLKVDVSMRTTYVTVDRAGWFDPSFFDMSKSFMRGTDDNNYTPWCIRPTTETVNDATKVKTIKEQTPDEATEAIRKNTADKPKGYLAAFPVGYVLVKDCVIKIFTGSSTNAATKSHFDQQAESSGGFLCFSHSSASRSSSDSSTSSTRQASDGLVVRIPGPQILGYIMQLTGNDNTQSFKPTPIDELFVEDEDDSKNSPNNANKGPAHDVGPGSSASEASKARVPGIRKYDDEFPSSSTANDRGAAKPEPAHGVQNPADQGQGQGHLIDALKAALGDSEVSDWLKTQPEGTKSELWDKLSAVFGKAAKSG